MLGATRTDTFNRLADPLRGRFSNYDELTSEDEKSSSSSSPNKKKTMRSPSNLEKSQKLRKDSNKVTYSAGFFLTEAVENYEDEEFEMEETSDDSDDKTVTSYQMRIEREKCKVQPTKRSKSGHQKSRELSKKYDKEINDSQSRSVHDLLAYQTNETNTNMRFESDCQLENDDVLSRVKKRLEEATALEYLIQQNQIREEIINESRIRHQKVEKLPPVTKTVKITPKSKSVQPKYAPMLPSNRKKVWEDPLKNKTPHKMRIIKTVLSSNTENTDLKGGRNSFMNKFTKNKILINPNDKIKKNNTIDNCRLSKNNKGNNGNNAAQVYGELNRDDIQFSSFTAKRLNQKKEIKKDIFLSQLQGRSRIEKENSKENKRNRRTIPNKNDNSRLPLISEKKRFIPPPIPSPIRVAKLRNERNEAKNTFLTDFSGVDFERGGGKDIEIIDKEELKNISIRKNQIKMKNVSELNEKIRNNLAKKRIESKSAPNLNYLQRVDKSNKINNNNRNNDHEKYSQNEGSDTNSKSEKNRNEIERTIDRDRTDRRSLSPSKLKNLDENNAREITGDNKTMDIRSLYKINNAYNSINNNSNNNNNSNKNTNNNNISNGNIDDRKSTVRAYGIPSVRSTEPMFPPRNNDSQKSKSNSSSTNATSANNMNGISGINSTNVNGVNENGFPGNSGNPNYVGNTDSNGDSNGSNIDRNIDMNKKGGIKKKNSISSRPTDELITLLSQVEVKESSRLKVTRGSIDEGDNAAAQLVKHAKKLGSHWAAAESYASKYNSFGDDDLELE